MRPLPRDWRPCDIGYTMVAFCVDDLDAAIERAAASRQRAAHRPGRRARGAARLRARPGRSAGRADGGRPARPRAPRAPARRARRRGALGDALRPRPRALAAVLRRRARARGGRRPRACTGPSTRRCGAWRARTRESHPAVGGRLPRRARPLHGAAGKAVAAGLPDLRPGPAEHRLRLSPARRVRGVPTALPGGGAERNGPPLRLGPWSVVYVNDDQGFSVELLHVEPWYERQMGFRPRPTPRLAPFAGRTPARLRAERRFAKALVTGRRGRAGDGARAGCWPRTRPRSSSSTATRTACRGWRPSWGMGRRWRTLELDLADLEAVDYGHAPSWSPSTRTSTS